MLRVFPNQAPAPRLLYTAAKELRPSSTPDDADAKLARAGFWGNGFAIFVGIAVAGILICGVSTIMITHHTSVEQVAPARLVVVVPTPTPTPAAAVAVPAALAPSDRAEPQVSIESLHLTSIALGHPRLAVINRQAVTEGDWVYVPSTTGQVRLRLRVIKIADGNVQLTLGRRVYTVPLAQMKLKPAR